MSIFGRKIKSTPKRPEKFSLVSLILSPDSVNFFKLNKDIWIWMPQCAILFDREKISCWLNLVQSTHIKAAASNSVEFVGPDTPQKYWKKNEDCYLQSFLRKQLQYKPSKNQTFLSIFAIWILRKNILVHLEPLFFFKLDFSFLACLLYVSGTSEKSNFRPFWQLGSLPDLKKWYWPLEHWYKKWLMTKSRRRFSKHLELFQVKKKRTTMAMADQFCMHPYRIFKEKDRLWPMFKLNHQFCFCSNQKIEMLNGEKRRNKNLINLVFNNFFQNVQ